MRFTTHTTCLSRKTTASPQDVYAAIEDLSTFPAWWELEPPEKMDGSEYRIVPQEGGVTARPGFVFAVERSAGSFTFRSGRVWSWEAETKDYVCELAEPGSRLRLALQNYDRQTTTFRAVDVAIEPRGSGSTVTLRVDYEVAGRGPLRALQRWVVARPSGHRYSIRKLVESAEGPTGGPV